MNKPVAPAKIENTQFDSRMKVGGGTINTGVECAPAYRPSKDASGGIDNMVTVDTLSDQQKRLIMPPNPTADTIFEQMKQTLSIKGDEVFVVWHDDQGKAVNEYTFRQLWEDAGYCAHLLRNKWKVRKGDKVVLCYGFGLHFFAVFLGCLRAGAIAVVVYPPFPPLVKSLTKMNKIIDDCKPALILTESKIQLYRQADMANPFSKSRGLWPRKVKYQVTDRYLKPDGLGSSDTSSRGRNWISRLSTPLRKARNQRRRHQTPRPQFDDGTVTGSDLAFFQYTSGSTGNPKGVMVSHKALRANTTLLLDGSTAAYTQRQAGSAPLPQMSKFIGFSWAPQYHDMGLIQMAITPFLSGCEMHMTSPLAFIKNPVLWLEIMSEHKCQFSAAPDFALRLSVRKFKEQMARSNRGARKAKSANPLDLSHVVSLSCGAEPIRLDTQAIFSEAFCPFGLRDDWLFAGYGLAENVIGVSWLNGFHLSTKRANDLQQFVAVGHIERTKHHSIDIKIVNPETCEEVPSGSQETGEIWISGPTVAAGYYQQPQLTQEIFHAKLKDCTAGQNGSGGDNSVNVSEQPARTYLRTDDYGFIQDGYLYMCGRKTDTIIDNGSMFYPQNIEYVAQDVSKAVRPGCIAAFSSNESGRDGELEIVFEIRFGQEELAPTVCDDIRKAVSQQIGLAPSRIVTVKERSIAKTTSGKIQRRRNRTLLHSNEQSVVHEARYNTSTSMRA